MGSTQSTWAVAKEISRLRQNTDEKMAGGFRTAHPSYMFRYTMGFFFATNWCCWMSEHYYGVPRTRDQNSKWCWWADFMNKKRAGDIEEDMPGYMYAKWHNRKEMIAWRNHGREYEGYPHPEDV